MSNRVRHSLTRSLRSTGLALVAALVFAWHPALAAAQTLAPSDVLRIAQIEQVTNFDPALMSTQDMGVLIDNVYEGLIGTERDTTRLVPRLAEKWTLAPTARASPSRSGRTSSSTTGRRWTPTRSSTRSSA